MIERVKGVYLYFFKHRTPGRDTYIKNYLPTFKLLRGRILEIGSGGDILKKVALSANEVILTNIEQRPSMDVICDGKKLSFKSAIFDNVIIISVFEHEKNYTKIIDETYRVLKKGGKCFVSVPFLYPIHMEPNDFFRMTEYKYRNDFMKFSDVSINVQDGNLIGRCIGLFYYFLRNKSSKLDRKFPLAYWIEAIK
jgi:SAM-dependent methyltransferase